MDDEQTVKLAQDGDVTALEQLVRQVQDRVYRLALRMLANPEAAQDASQEILIRVVTKLSTFEGKSSFNTWVHRVAVNYLLTAKKVISRDPMLSFEDFQADLESGLVRDDAPPQEDQVMLNDLRIRCTMAMLLCLDRNHRAAYVLGEVLEFSQSEAVAVLGVSKAVYRKRLSRARADVIAFTRRSCGLASAAAACRCSRRLPAAQAAGRLSEEGENRWPDAPAFKDIEADAARTQAALITAKLQRATGDLKSPHDLAKQVISIVTPPV